MRQKLWNRWFLLPLLAIIVMLIAFFTTTVSAEETTESPLSQEDVVVEEMPSEEVVPEPVIPESQPSEPVQQPQAEEQVLKTQTAPENNVSDFASLKQQIDQAQADTPVSIKITQGFDWTSTIYVNNSKHIELTSDEPVVLLKNGSGYFFSITNGTLLLNGSLVFDINGKGNGFYIGDNANMEINDDVVIKKSSSPAIYMGGYDSEVVMNGGTMTENAGYRGSCVYLYMGTAWSSRNGGSTFIMNDGVMENNNATDGGGAVFIEGGGRFIMNGGVMRKNRSDRGGAVGTFDLWTYIVGKRAYTYRGDAIYTSGNISHPYSEWANYYPAAFIMNNGILENNRGRVGGAVYIASSGCVINGGQIINNYASSQGGGVYVSSVPYVLHISRAIVSGNSAYIGGGMWYCPTGEAKITVTDGTAIYENNASGAGDDFAAVISSYSIWGDRPSTTISDRMLGGGKNVWVRDGAVYRGDLGSANKSVPRYDPEDPKYVSGIRDYEYALILKSLASPEAIAAALPYGLVFISGNTSSWGGGIGANGEVIFGVAEAKEIQVHVQKLWEGKNIPEEITVYLVNTETGARVDSAVLNETNGWNYVFDGLPENIRFTIEEDIPAGYIQVSQSEETDEFGNHSIVITNAEQKYGSLRIEKSLLGEDLTPEEYKRAFEFLVTFEDGGTYEYTGTYQGWITSGDIIGLAHGEYIVIVGLPERLSYNIAEILSEDDDYEIIVENENGIILADDEITVHFINARFPVLPEVPEEPKEPEPEEPETPKTPEEPKKEVPQPKKAVHGVQTSTHLPIASMGMMMAISILGISVLKKYE